MKKLIILLNMVLLFSCSKSDEESEPNIPEPNPNIENTAPTIPLKVFPTSSLLCTNNPVEFRWNSSTDKEGNPISYEIELSLDQSFTNIIEKRTVTELSTLVELEKGIEINWRIRAKDSNGAYSNYAPSWNFYTEGEGVLNYLPYTPTLIYPEAFTKVNDNTVVLNWTSTDVDGDVILYDIYFGDTVFPILIKENAEESNYEISISPNKTYYWKIIAKDGSGGQSIGDLWNFKS